MEESQSRRRVIRRPSCPFYCLSNALHDLGGLLHESRRCEEALQLYDESRQARVQSVMAGSVEGYRECLQANGLLADAKRKFQSTMMAIQRLLDEREASRATAMAEPEANEDLSLVPLFFLPPNHSPLSWWWNEQGGAPRHSLESAQMMYNVALCLLARTAPDYSGATQHLAMATQVLTFSSTEGEEEEREHLLLVTDLLHIQAFVQFAHGLWAEAEALLKEALSLLRLQDQRNPPQDENDLEERACEENAISDALSLLLPVSYLLGHCQNDEDLTRSFQNLLDFRSSLLDGAAPLRVAATLCGMGIFLILYFPSLGEAEWAAAQRCVEGIFAHHHHSGLSFAPLDTAAHVLPDGGINANRTSTA